MDYSQGYGRTGMYRSRDGILFGVCRGLAEYFDISVFWTRVIVVIAFIISGFFPVGVAYILGALLMKPEPRYRY
jgi:phage shock protein C